MTSLSIEENRPQFSSQDSQEIPPTLADAFQTTSVFDDEVLDRFKISKR
jgi:hypothetical protein